MATADPEEPVLHLLMQERARLAHKLLESLDLPSEGEIGQGWVREAQHRAEEIDLGKVQLISSDELEHQVQPLFK